MDILESLYYGLIIPAERQRWDNEPYSRTLERLKRSETRMLDMLDKEQREVFAQYDETMLNLSGIAEREAFACGFALALRISMEALSGRHSIQPPGDGEEDDPQV